VDGNSSSNVQVVAYCCTSRQTGFVASAVVVINSGCGEGRIGRCGAVFCGVVAAGVAVVGVVLGFGGRRGEGLISTGASAS
jgi:hypothetical protein